MPVKLTDEEKAATVLIIAVFLAVLGYLVYF